MTPDERKVQGPAINGLKDRVTAAIAARKDELGAAALDARLAAETVDVTLPVREAPAESGRVHPISQVIDELTAIFADMGFAVAEGPDIETDDYNFTKLNFPEGHPAREMHDTFYFPPKAGRLAPVAAHAHLAGAGAHHAEPEAADPRHHPGPHLSQRQRPDPHADVPPGRGPGDRQGLASRPPEMDPARSSARRSSRCDSVKMRFRPSFFPFTEPSLEVDIQCRRDKGEIRFGEGEDWLEILGCGMVHPNVLRNCGLDPDEYQGFAWGMGIDRIAMLKYGMPDLRAFFEADVRWLDALRLPAARLPDAGGRIEHELVMIAHTAGTACPLPRSAAQGSRAGRRR